MSFIWLNPIDLKKSMFVSVQTFLGETNPTRSNRLRATANCSSVNKSHHGFCNTVYSILYFEGVDSATTQNQLCKTFFESSFSPYLIIYPPPLYSPNSFTICKNLVSPCKVAANSKLPDKIFNMALWNSFVLTDFYPSFFFQYFRPDYSYSISFPSAPVWSPIVSGRLKQSGNRFSDDPQPFSYPL